MTVFEFLIVVLASSGLITVWLKGSLFAPWRARVETWQGPEDSDKGFARVRESALALLGEGLLCKFCLTFSVPVLLGLGIVVDSWFYHAGWNLMTYQAQTAAVWLVMTILYLPGLVMFLFGSFFWPLTCAFAAARTCLAIDDLVNSRGLKGFSGLDSIGHDYELEVQQRRTEQEFTEELQNQHEKENDDGGKTTSRSAGGRRAASRSKSSDGEDTRD
jgi:hypothetical protein